MAASSSAPQTHSQPSRKGKKAWRKNVDISQVTTGIDAAREEATLTGGHLFADAAAESLFQTDTAGDISLQKRARKEHGPLKADEIIAARSRVPAVETHKRPGDAPRVTDGVITAGNKRKRDGKGVSHKELERLKRLAYGGDGVHKNIVETPDAAAYDPWAPVPAPVPDPAQSYLERHQAPQAPKTLSQPPAALTVSGKAAPNVRKPIAGHSYNPAFPDWSALLEREGEKAVEAEKQRLRLEAEEQQRQEAVAAAVAEAEKENEERALLSEYESEWEGIQSEAEFSDTQLKAKRPTRKTPAERNKIERRKKQAQLDRHERRMKERERQEKEIDAIRRAVESGSSKTLAKTSWDGFGSDADSDSDVEEEALRRRRGRGTRFGVPDAPLELVLPDELQDSLRKLKPEGNLLKDRFRNMILQGKMEARNPIQQPKRAKNKKATEKWQYKDWKLPSRA